MANSDLDEATLTAAIAKAREAAVIANAVEPRAESAYYDQSSDRIWVKYDAAENFVPANRQDAESFLETIAVEMVYPHQLQLVKPAEETVEVRARLAAVLDELSEDLLAEVQDFAEFLLQKQQKFK